MKNRRIIRRWAIAPALAGILMLSACGSGGAPEAVVLPSSNGQHAADGGYMLPDCTGVDPANCVYDGFDPAVNGFSFANWAAVGTVDATSLVALFGEEAVCAETTAEGCVLFPAAEQWAAQVNEAMVGGRCEGMAVMAQRLFSNSASLIDLDPAATSTFAPTFFTGKKSPSPPAASLASPSARGRSSSTLPKAAARRIPGSYRATSNTPDHGPTVRPIQHRTPEIPNLPRPSFPCPPPSSRPPAHRPT